MFSSILIYIHSILFSRKSIHHDICYVHLILRISGRMDLQMSAPWIWRKFSQKLVGTSAGSHTGFGEKSEKFCVFFGS